jgi:Tol biopolymer transport system component
MGEVYRARDTRLDRTVAIKVLAPGLAADPEFRQRFHAEARAISQLTHPHICTLYDIGEYYGATFLVMELLAGETLADRLARGSPESPALSLDHALQVGIQIADALAVAHQHGIIHRDLKPGNVMLTKQGTGQAGVPHAKLLDFGLAKSASPVATSGGSLLPTTPPQAVTAQGAILGTIQYMAPEQIEGGLVDARSDIFALGSVLYEMLTNRHAFEGKTQASVMAAILEREPAPVSTLAPRAPTLVEAMVRKCLAKNPDERWQSAADLATALRWTVGGAFTVTGEAIAPPVDPRHGHRRRVSRSAVVATIAVAAFVAGGVLAWRFLSTTLVPAPTTRFELQPPPNAMWSPAPVSSIAQLALSPDGQRLAFVASARRGRSQIWIRPLNDVQAQALAGTEGASFPFWSPDSRFIAFFADGKLKKVETNGGRPQTLGDAPSGRGGTWGPDGVIVFTPTPSQGLFRAAAEGGAVTPVTMPEETGGITHYWPQFLPGGRRVIFYQRSARAESQGVYVVDLQTQTVVRVLSHDGKVVHVPRYLLLVRDGMLFAQAFDDRQLQVIGEPVRIADSVGSFGSTFGDAAVTAAPTGVLVHGPILLLTTALQWRDRSGAITATVAPPGVYRSPRLSSDERTLALTLVDQPLMSQPDIWTLDLIRGTPTRLTSDPRNDWFAVWSPDDSRIFFGSTRLGSTVVFRKNPTGSADDEALTQPTSFGRYPTDITRNGDLLVFQQVASDGYDLGFMTANSDPTLTEFLATKFNEVQGRLAPNQRWIAYASDESGRFQVYVRPFPAGPGQTAISVGGGMQPEWRRDGKELFYIAADGKLMAVDVMTDGSALPACPGRYSTSKCLRPRHPIRMTTPSPQMASASSSTPSLTKRYARR